MRPWTALFLAITCEVTGTLSLQLLAPGSPGLAAIITGGAVTLSYLLLSLAFRRIPTAVAFAVWEAAGLTMITVLSIWLFGQHLTLPQWLALGGVALGAHLVHSGTRTGGHT